MTGEFDQELVQSEDEFDAQLLCPDVIIEEKNGYIVTTNDDTEIIGPPSDYNVTGIKARFHLNNIEERLRCQIYKPIYPVQNSRLHCTACNTHLGSALNCVDNVFVHPVLAVLVCNGCFQYYTGGVFEKDEDGAEMYCRWCGQGGQVFCCSKCPMVFCKPCVRINFSAAQYSAIRDSDYWECFWCNPSQIMHLKVQCYEFVKYVTTEIVRIQNGPEPEFYMSIDYSQCCLGNRKKRSKKDDPDFVPNASVVGPLDKYIKRTKLKKREEVPLVEVKNLEPLGAQKNINMSTPPIIGGPKFTSTPGTTHQVQIPVPKPKENLVPVMYPTTPTHHYSQQPVQNFNIVNYLYNNQKVPKTLQVPTSLTPTIIRPLLPKSSPHMSVHFPQNQLRFPAPMYTLRPTFPAPSTIINRPPLFRNNNPNSTVNINETSSAKRMASDDFRILVRKTHEMDKHLLSVALANSTFASTLLKINQMFSDVNTIEDIVVVYDTLQKSLKLMTESLMDVKIRTNVGSRSASHRIHAERNQPYDVGNQAQGHSRLPVLKVPFGLPPTNYIQE